MNKESRAEQLRCAGCGTTDNVALRSPDMDIEPVAFCTACWFELLEPMLEPKELPRG